MATAKKPSLSNDEIQALADRAIAVWAVGVPDETHDSLGDRWEFEPVRSESSRLILRRFKRPPATDESGLPYEAELAGETQVPAYEFAVEEVRAIVASRVLALANPAAP